eukprot:Hpha_TRINITY_DN7552_c0_g1::TRINITY_DN7552_c0_g1_i2::g.18947::m.18947
MSEYLLFGQGILFMLISINIFKIRTSSSVIGRRIGACVRCMLCARDSSGGWRPQDPQVGRRDYYYSWLERFWVAYFVMLVSQNLELVNFGNFGNFHVTGPLRGTTFVEVLLGDALYVLAFVLYFYLPGRSHPRWIRYILPCRGFHHEPGEAPVSERVSNGSLSSEGSDIDYNWGGRRGEGRNPPSEGRAETWLGEEDHPGQSS